MDTAKNKIIPGCTLKLGSISNTDNPRRLHSVGQERMSRARPAALDPCPKKCLHVFLLSL
jgi:hypothetical protein